MQVNTMDLAALRTSPSPQLRAEIAHNLGHDFTVSDFSVAERALAIDIFRLLLRDAEAIVRRSLADSLCHAAHLPRDLALELARDIPEVATPVLQHSWSLSEDDLIAIVKSTSEAMKWSAIARRETLSSSLSEALVATRDERVIHLLVTNTGAAITEDALFELIELCHESETVLEALVHRGNLPQTVVQRLFETVAEPLKISLAEEYHLPLKVADDTVRVSRDWSVLEQIRPDLSTQMVDNVASELYASGKLTFSLVLRSLCLGDLRFFEAAMAELGGIPVINSRLLMLDPGGRGFRALYARTGMPADWCEAVKLLYDISLEETNFGRFKRDDFRKRIVERIVRGGYDRTIEAMPYLLNVLGAAHEIRDAA